MAKKRSVGILASGVIAILGSLAILLLVILMIPAVIAMRTNPELFRPSSGVPAPPFDPSVILIVEGILFFGVGVFGIFSAIGLLRLKNWARISFLVFAGLLGLFSISAILVTGFLLLVGIDIPQPPEVPEGALAAAFVAFLVVGVVLGALAVWWLIYFTRHGVRAQFLSEAEAALPRRGPLSVTIIAWILVIGGLMAAFALFFSYPVLLFGVVFSGWPARLIMAVFGLTGLVAGVGILRWRPWAFSLAVALYGFYLLNLLSYVVIPGGMARMQAIMQQTSSASAVPAFVPFTNSIFLLGVFMSALGVSVPLWFLLTRRRAYLDACEPSAAIQS